MTTLATRLTPVPDETPPEDEQISLLDEDSAPPAKPDRRPQKPMSAASRERRNQRRREKAQARPNAQPGPGRPKKETTSAFLAKELQQTIEGLAAMLALGGALASPALVYDAQVIGDRAKPLAVELVRLSEEAPWLRRGLQWAVHSHDGAKIGLLAASIALPIMANHGLVPWELAGWFGATPPADGTAPAPGPVAEVRDLFAPDAAAATGP